MIAAALLLLTALADARLIFTKSFPHSEPAYVAITVEPDGAAEFKTDPKDEQPVKFHLSPAETTELFALSEKVDLSHKLESGLKVAMMGIKTLRIEKDGKPAEQSFNYTEDIDARALADWFERISESERCFIDLERTAKYEKVGVYDALLELQTEWEKKRLVAPQQFLPLLDRVTKSESYMQIARNRAAALASTFRAIP